MNRLSLAERLVIGCARIIAGQERRHWLDALETELRHLPARRLDWALGSLVAAVKDRVGRDWPFGLAVGVLPGLAVAFTLVLSAVSFGGLKAAGLPMSLGYLAQAVAPLPFAFVLGQIRPRWPALRIGAAGFLAYQTLPFVAWHLAAGGGIWFFWGPTLWPLGVPLPLALPVWLAGAWWGATAARRARQVTISPRSP